MKKYYAFKQKHMHDCLRVFFSEWNDVCQKHLAFICARILPFEGLLCRFRKIAAKKSIPYRNSTPHESTPSLPILGGFSK